MTLRAQHKSHWLKKVVKGLSFLSVLILVLVGGIFTSWQLDPVKNWIKEYSVDQAQQLLTLPLEIQSIDGNLYSELRIKQLTIGDELTLDSLIVRYSLLDLLLNSTEIQSIEIYKPQIQLYEFADSSISVSKWFTPSKETESKKDTISSSFNFKISKFVLNDGNAVLDLPSKLPYKSITLDSLYLNSAFESNGKSYSVSLNELALQTVEPNLNDTLRLRLSGKANQDEILLLNSFLNLLKLQLVSVGIAKLTLIISMPMGKFKFIH